MSAASSATTEYRWRATNAPTASRTDDIWFLDAQRGWAVNSNGQIVRTTDGGETWETQLSAPGVYLRCVGFVDERVGWVGTLMEQKRLLATSDGGATWSAVEGLPPEAPPAICGLSVVNERVVYAAGSNFTDRPTGILKSTDGGESWSATDMSERATMLVDVHFLDERRGFAVGGKAEVAQPEREDCVPVVLATEDGGATWEGRLASLGDDLRSGEWAWKIQFLDDRVGFVSLENFTEAAILKTGDGGATWERKQVRDPQGNANIEGVGFLDASVGWAGGWGDETFQGGFTSETRDGGETWTNANHVGKFINRFRFVRGPELVAYASGATVYKYAPGDGDGAPSLAAPTEAPVVTTRLPVRVPIEVEPGAGDVRVDVWDRFGGHVATPLAEPAGAAVPPSVEWTGERSGGGTIRPGIYIVRVTVGERAESMTVRVDE